MSARQYISLNFWLFFSFFFIFIIIWGDNATKAPRVTGDERDWEKFSEVKDHLVGRKGIKVFSGEKGQLVGRKTLKNLMGRKDIKEFTEDKVYLVGRRNLSKLVGRRDI